jgi:hypothetical protein
MVVLPHIPSPIHTLPVLHAAPRWERLNRAQHNGAQTYRERLQEPKTLSSLMIDKMEADESNGGNGSRVIFREVESHCGLVYGCIFRYSERTIQV